MIVGLGIDLVELERMAAALERFGRNFAEKLLREEELDAMPAGPTAVAWLAARFAAKEAAAKALGTGFAQGVTLRDLEVRSLPSGRPEIVFHGRAAEVFAETGAGCAHVSLTHAKHTAAAVVILESP